MRKRIELLLTILLVMFLSGCVKYNIGMNISEDDDVTISITSAIAATNSNNDTNDQDDSGINYEVLLKRGFEKNSYRDDNWIGDIYTKNYGNIDEISSNEPVKVELSDLLDDQKEEVKIFFQKKKSLFKTTYIGNFTIDIETNATDEASEVDNNVINSMASSMDLKYYVNLPVKADSNNATEISEDGKTLTWKLDLVKVNSINYEFSRTNKFVVYSCIALGLLLVIIITIIIMTKFKKKGGNNFSNSGFKVEENSDINRDNNTSMSDVTDIDDNTKTPSQENIGPTFVSASEPPIVDNNITDDSSVETVEKNEVASPNVMPNLEQQTSIIDIDVKNSNNDQ